MPLIRTQFEAYLSLRKVSARGLVDAPPTQRRLSVVVMYGEQPAMEKYLIDTWAVKSPEEACSYLARPEYTAALASNPRPLPSCPVE